MTEPQQPREMAPPPNLFATPPPGMDPAVGSTFLPAPGLHGGYGRPGAYSLPAKPVVPVGLRVAAVLLGGAGLLALLGVITSSTDDLSFSLAMLLALGALFPVGAGIWLALKPSDTTRLTATLAAGSCMPLCACLAFTSDAYALSGFGFLMALPVLLLLWTSEPVQRYFRQLAQFRAAGRAG